MSTVSSSTDAADRGRAGGKKRAESLPPSERRAIAQKGADARWGKNIHKAEYVGPLEIANSTLDCAVLEDGRRIISQASIMEALGRSTSSGRRSRNENRPPFMEAANLQRYLTPEIAEKMQRVEYRLPRGKSSRYGYNAEILPDVCDLYLQAEEDGALIPNQLPAAQAARKLVRALAKVGIVALVDEATGYEDRRAKDELQRLLAAYVQEEFRPWVARFPEEFFKQVYRLHGWEFRPGNHQHPSYVGKFIMNYIYKALPQGIAEELQRVNPIVTEKGNRSRKHHQHIQDGAPAQHLDRLISNVTTLMKISEDKQEFQKLYARFDDSRVQALPLPID